MLRRLGNTEGQVQTGPRLRRSALQSSAGTERKHSQGSLGLTNTSLMSLPCARIPMREHVEPAVWNLGRPCGEPLGSWATGLEGRWLERLEDGGEKSGTRDGSASGGHELYVVFAQRTPFREWRRTITWKASRRVPNTVWPNSWHIGSNSAYQGWSVIASTSLTRRHGKEKTRAA